MYLRLFIRVSVVGNQRFGNGNLCDLSVMCMEYSDEVDGLNINSVNTIQHSFFLLTCDQKFIS